MQLHILSSLFSHTGIILYNNYEIIVFTTPESTSLSLSLSHYYDYAVLQSS